MEFSMQEIQQPEIVHVCIMEQLYAALLNEKAA
jgi:hypothetical protein